MIGAVELITNSRMRAFHACQRLHQIAYVFGYRSLAARDEANFGTLIHAGLEGWWTAHMRREPASALPWARARMAKAIAGFAEMDPAATEKAEILMGAYDARWAPEMEALEVLAVEVQFRARLRSPSGRARRGLDIAGKLDAIARKRTDGSTWMVEHKTSGADLSPGSSYWQRLRMDPQVSMYYDGARSLGHELAGCLYDVIVRPDQRLYTATPVEKRKYTKDGRLYANQRDRDETMGEFRERITALISENPNAYFQRAEIVRLPEELVTFTEDVNATASLIRSARKGQAPRNPDNCFRYNRPCDYYDVCCGAASLEDETRFRKMENVHPELEKQEEEA